MDLPSDGQVQAVAVLAQVGDRRAYPHAPQVVGWGYADARGIGPVGVLDDRVAFDDTRFAEGPLYRRLRVGLSAPHRDGAIRPVKVVMDVQVVLHLAKERQHLGIGPLIIAHGGPVVIVLGQPALHGLAVDGGPTPDHFPLCHVDFALFLGGHPSQGPVVLRLGGLGVAGVAVFHLVRDVVEVRVIPAGLQEEYRPVWVFRQPAGQDGSRGPAPNDNDVVLHGSSQTLQMRDDHSGYEGDLTTRGGMASTVSREGRA